MLIDDVVTKERENRRLWSLSGVHYFNAKLDNRRSENSETEKKIYTDDRSRCFHRCLNISTGKFSSLNFLKNIHSFIRKNVNLLLFEIDESDQLAPSIGSFANQFNGITNQIVLIEKKKKKTQIHISMSTNQTTKDGDQQSEFCQKFACDLQTCLDSKTFVSRRNLFEYSSL